MFWEGFLYTLIEEFVHLACFCSLLTQRTWGISKELRHYRRDPNGRVPWCRCFVLGQIWMENRPLTLEWMSQRREKRERSMWAVESWFKMRDSSILSVFYPSLHPMRQINEFDLRAFWETMTGWGTVRKFWKAERHLQWRYFEGGSHSFCYDANFCICVNNTSISLMMHQAFFGSCSIVRIYRAHNRGGEKSYFYLFRLRDPNCAKICDLVQFLKFV